MKASKEETKEIVSKKSIFNFIKSPKFYIPASIFSGIAVVGLTGILIMNPGIARGEFDLQSLMDMVLRHETKINKIEQKSEETKQSSNTTNGTSTTSLKGLLNSNNSTESSNNDGQTSTPPITNTPATQTEPTTPTTPTPPTLPTCNESLAAVYQSTYNLKVDSENTRYTNEVESIKNDFSSRGIYRSGLLTTALANADNTHSSNLSLLYNGYVIDLSAIHCSL